MDIDPVRVVQIVDDLMWLIDAHNSDKTSVSTAFDHRMAASFETAKTEEPGILASAREFRDNLKQEILRAIRCEDAC